MMILYFCIAIGATTIGAVTGMGGGVFMKPILDILGDFPVSTISILSAITVFAMALVSVYRQRNSDQKPETAVAVPLAVGAVVGGNVGSLLLSRLMAGMPGARVTLVQNVVLAALVVFVVIYMRNKERIISPKLSGAVPSALVGLALGVIASFLGIGGGPINVALIVLLFDYSTKKAAACSLITILFSQAAKLVQTALTVSFASFDLQMAPVMVIGAIAGGTIGAVIAKGIDEKATNRLFQGAQVLILLICAVNILRNR